MMRFSTAAVLASFLLASSGAALAQVEPEVTVNPAAAAPGQTLLYPGGTYTRTVAPLLQPGESASETGPIVLHLPSHRRTVETAAAPRHRRHKAEAVATAEPAPAETAPAEPTPAPEPKPFHHSAHKTATAKVPVSGYNPGYGNFGAPQATTATRDTPASTPPRRGTSTGTADLGDNLVVAHPGGETAPAAPRQQMAKAEPPPAAHPAAAAEHATPGLSKRSVILFAPGAPDPAASALGAIKFLAGDLNAAMTGPSTRVQLDAFGGAKGDKGSDARRLSLKRALAIRQVLIDDGVPAERIDVRAMGGVDDSGPSDRVDVYVKA